jgi:hypothetical protein
MEMITIAAGESGPDGKRAPPKAIKLLLPVWGYRYLTQFLEFGLPTLIAPGNLPALAKALPCEFEFLTSREDEALLRQHPSFLGLTKICPVSIRRIDHLITAGSSSVTITLAFAEAIRAAGPAILETCFFFLVSDYIFADGSLESVLARLQAGASAVLVGNFQVIAEDASPWLRDQITSQPASLPLRGRDLVRWALGHLHPATAANIVNVSEAHNAHTNRLFWRVDSNTLLGRFYLMHMIAIRPEVTDFNIGSSCDYSFVPEMCPSGNVSVVTDSDAFLVVELQPRGHESELLRPGALEPNVLARTLREWTTARHRQNVDYSIVYHAAERPAALPAAVAAADAYVEKVRRRLRGRPQPHYGHPYWLGSIAAFRAASGQRIGAEELHQIVGPQSWRGLWIERLRAALYGIPPRVRPWHPRWPDYRSVLVGLASFLADPGKRLLLVGDKPTRFSVMLAERGERVVRLQTSPFLKSAPEAFKPYAGYFDACLLELQERDLGSAGDLAERISPLMKDGGSLLIVVYNERPIEEAAQFGNDVARVLQRLPALSAAASKLRFVPANRLRRASQWAFARLGTAVHQRPWLGIPGLAILAGPLTLLTLLANLLAAAGTRAHLRHGIASSLHLVVPAPARGNPVDRVVATGSRRR